MAERTQGYQLGVDVGGTFTDLVLRSPDGGRVVLKLPSTPADPAGAVLSGMDRLLAENGVAPDQLTFWAHGTTTATNTIIERSGTRVGLLTTAGFGDLLEIRRQQRPSLYDFFADKPEALVPASRRFEITERMSAHGDVIRQPDEREVRAMVRRLRDEGVQAVAVCFLHSYQNPQHERWVADIVRRELPSAYLSVSSEVLPEFREYERLSTTVLNAYLGPSINRYVGALGEELSGRGLACTPYVLQSNGHLMTFAAAQHAPIRLIASGPSAGVIGAGVYGELTGQDRVLTVDMGGTSADVGTIVEGRPRMTTVREVAGYPLKTPTVEVLSIGAGGGSIAWVDRGGFLRVGPHSAGADPGPACYGRGGPEPTVTDAHLLLGRLNPCGLLQGDMSLHTEESERALAEVGGALKWGAAETAQGIIRLVNAEMSRALRGVLAVRGDDPRSFIMFAYGGAGPLHACDLARSLGIRSILVPPDPGSFCASGALMMEVGMDFGQTCRLVLERRRVQKLPEAFAQVEHEARAWLEREGVPTDVQGMERTIEARYVGQDYELPVHVKQGLDDLAAITEAFHAVHHNAYGYSRPDHQVECVTIRVYAYEVSEGNVVCAVPSSQRSDQAEPESVRNVWWEGMGFVETPIYRRNELPVGWRDTGPAVIEQFDTTTLVPPGVSVRVDYLGNVFLDID